MSRLQQQTYNDENKVVSAATSWLDLCFSNYKKPDKLFLLIQREILKTAENLKLADAKEKNR